MKKLAFLAAVVLVFFSSCQQETSAEEHDQKETATASKQEPQVHNPLLKKYEQFLAGLDSSKVENMSKAAEKYKELFKGQPQSLADSGYVLFDRFYLSVDNAINELHANDTTDFYPLVTVTKEPIPNHLLVYNGMAKANGFEVDMAEGGTYLNQDRDFIAKNFYSFLSPTLQEYLNQLNKENKEGYTVDAGLAILPTQLADRVIWWESFIKKHPNFIFQKEAKLILEDYLTTLIVGMDNTPVLNYENSKLTSEYVSAYQNLQKKAPNSKANKAVQPYFRALQMQDTVRANALIRQYQKEGIIFNPNL